MIAGIRAQTSARGGEALPIEVRVAVGEVSAVHALGRDRVMLPHPCVEARCLTLGGMSGGPAFDSNGHLLGILSSSIEHDEGPSYVSLWWPVAGDQIESSWPSGIIRLPTTILAMAQGGALGIVRPEALDVKRMDSGQRTEIGYLSWT